MVKNPSFLRQVSSHFKKHDDIIIVSLYFSKMSSNSYEQKLIL